MVNVRLPDKIKQALLWRGRPWVATVEAIEPAIGWPGGYFFFRIAGCDLLFIRSCKTAEYEELSRRPMPYRVMLQQLDGYRSS